ncbi:hypothetical protein CDIK_1181 [Cucumispora dikerogammari]|nr:hypothetical protein CDIK_1181 [Cucumispora dikerogammari]
MASSFKDDEVIVHNAKIEVKAERLHSNLIYIHKNYGFLRDIIKHSKEKLFRIEDAIKFLSKHDSFEDKAEIHNYIKQRYKKKFEKLRSLLTRAYRLKRMINC